MSHASIRLALPLFLLETGLLQERDLEHRPMAYRNQRVEAGSHLSPQPVHRACGGLSLGCQGDPQSPACEEGWFPWRRVLLLFV